MSRCNLFFPVFGASTGEIDADVEHRLGPFGPAGGRRRVLGEEEVGFELLRLAHRAEVVEAIAALVLEPDALGARG